MNELILSTESNNGYTSVSNIFISEYVPDANGEFVKIYLYLLYLTSQRNNNISVSSLADTFNQTEADIMRALRYWDKLGTLSLSFDGPDKALSNITLNDIEHINKASSVSDVPESYDTDNVDINTNHIKTSDVSTAHLNNSSVPVVSASPIEPSKIQYTPEKLTELSSDENFSMLLFVVESYLSRPLSGKETNAIVYFYDTLNFSIELIDFLFEYCVEHNKKSINYIETVALSWAAKGIQTIEQAKEEVSNHTDSIYQVMKAFGLSNREPGQHEKAMISKWADTYCFDTDMIIEACNRTIKAIHQPSFEYADTILSNWKNSNVRSIEDVKKADAIYASANNARNRHTTVVKQSANRFNNFQQRDKKSDDWYNSLLSNNN